nr:nucleotidyltransferase domain-containing protein [Paraburkholderia sp. SG-MS1]
MLYGSRAKGNHRPDSDADLALVLADSHERRIDAILALADDAFDVLLDTSILIEPLVVWKGEWRHPKPSRTRLCSQTLPAREFCAIA